MRRAVVHTYFCHTDCSSHTGLHFIFGLHHRNDGILTEILSAYLKLSTMLLHTHKHSNRYLWNRNVWRSITTITQFWLPLCVRRTRIHRIHIALQTMWWGYWRCVFVCVRVAVPCRTGAVACIFRFRWAMRLKTRRVIYFMIHDT